MSKKRGSGQCRRLVGVRSGNAEAIVGGVGLGDSSRSSTKTSR